MSLVVSITLSFNHAQNEHDSRNAPHDVETFHSETLFHSWLDRFRPSVNAALYMNFLESSPRGFFARSNPSFARETSKDSTRYDTTCSFVHSFFFFNFSIAIHKRISIVVEKLG